MAPRRRPRGGNGDPVGGVVMPHYNAGHQRSRGTQEASARRPLQLTVIRRRVGLLALIDDDPDLMLDTVDLILWSLHARTARPGFDRSEGDRIAGLVIGVMSALEQASSAYTVKATRGWRLERRVDETAEQAFQAAVEQERHSSDLLKQAWVSTFKRDPDPGAAFRASVLAVESVATQVFTPKDGRPSLGKAIAHLRSTVGQWTVSGLDDQQQASGKTLLAMLQTVWENDQRHVGEAG